MDGKQREDRQDTKGLISADRNSKATLPLTVPRPIRVVCRRSSPRNCPVGLRRRPWETIPFPGLVAGSARGVRDP